MPEPPVGDDLASSPAPAPSPPPVPAPRITGGELARKVVHMGVGSLAFLLRFLGPAWSALLALSAVVFNLFVLPRIGGRRLWREAEITSGRSLGIVLYPVSVLLLILVFWPRLEVAAAAWGILAFGDGMASVVGMTLGRRKLPWNPKKSWAGTAAYFLFGAAAAGALLVWTAPGRYDVGFAFAAAAVAALAAALLESVPQGLDDNLGVPLVSGLLLLGLVLGQGGWGFAGDDDFLVRVLVGAGVNALLAGLGYAARSVDLSGVVAGWLVGTIIYAFLDWRGYLVLLAFFVLGTAFTKLGYRRKAAENLAQEKGGRRGARHALANTSVAAACAVFAATTPYPVFFTVAFVAAFATAASDTAGSEIGQLLGRRAYLATTFRRVPRGTDGAVSVEGTLAGIAASLVVGAVGWAAGLYSGGAVVLVAVAAFFGTWLESVAGSTLERRRLLDNEAINFLNTLVGALIGGTLSFLLFL